MNKFKKRYLPNKFNSLSYFSQSPKMWSSHRSHHHAAGRRTHTLSGHRIPTRHTGFIVGCVGEMFLLCLLSTIRWNDGSAGAYQCRRRLRTLRSDVKTIPYNIQIVVFQKEFRQHGNDTINAGNHDVCLTPVWRVTLTALNTANAARTVLNVKRLITYMVWFKNSRLCRWRTLMRGR